MRDYPPTISTVPADPALMEQALVNILENAIAYSPDGSRIEAAVYEDERNVVISIEDEGKGIPTTQLQQVFEKFQRLSESSSDRGGQGTGLGLAIAKGFVEAMGGRIAAASPIDAGRGTRILISLPKEKPTPHWLLSGAPMSAYKPRILVIDDEPQMHRFLGPALTAAGFEPMRADDGAGGPAGHRRRPRPMRWCSTSACPTWTARTC